MLFSPIHVKDKRAATQEALRAFIKTKTKPGDKLPPIRSLETMLSVSRMTLVSAINGLISEGFLRSEHGKGNYVTESSAQTRHIALILADFKNEMQDFDTNRQVTRLSSYLQQQLPECYFQILRFPYGSFADTFKPDDFTKYDALIYFYSRHENISALSTCGRPVIQLGGNISVFPSIRFNIIAMRTMCIDLLAKYGHGNILFIDYEPLPHYDNTLTAYINSRFSRCTHWYLLNPETKKIDSSQINTLFSSISVNTAVFCGDEYITDYVLKICHLQKMQIPDALSVISLFTGGVLSENPYPGLQITGIRIEDIWGLSYKKIGEYLSSAFHNNLQPEEYIINAPITEGNSILPNKKI